MTYPRGAPANSGGILEYQASIAVAPDRDVLEPPPVFESWTTFVSHRAVRAIAVAPLSRTAWIATWGGVLAWNRRDEYVYRRYSSEHGLAGTPSCIAVGDDDRAWVGHIEGGLSFFDGDRWYPYEYLRMERVTAIAAATGGRMWVATPDAIALAARGARPVEVVRGDADCAGATALLADGDGVFVASPSGLFRVSERTAVTRVRGDTINECSALARMRDGTVVVGTPSGVVFADETSVAPDRGDAAVVALAPTRGGVWVLTRTGIARVENGEWRTLRDAPANMAAPRAIAAARPNDDYLWVGTDDLLAGVRATGDAPWDVGLLPRHPEDILNNIGRCAFADEQERVCIGTAGGLFLGEPDGTWSFDEALGDVRSGFARSSFSDESTWLVAWPAGVLRATRPERTWKPIAVQAGLPRAVVAGHALGGHVLVGDNIWSIDTQGPERSAFGVPAHTRFVAHELDTSWFAATDRGLFQFSDGVWSLEPALGVGPISSLAKVLFSLWAGGDGVIWRRDDTGWTRFALTHAGDAWTEPVTALATTGRYDEMWIACGGRVARCSAVTGAVLEVHDRFDSGICGSDITALAEVGGVLWVVSRSGIARRALAP